MSAALPDAFYHLSLTPTQIQLLESLTPFRFRRVPCTSSPSSEPFLEPSLPLAAPPDVPYALLLTPFRPTDVPAQVAVLNHPAVAFNLVGPPYPYRAEHAVERFTAFGAETSRYWARVGELAAKALEEHGSVEAAVEALSREELPTEWLPSPEAIGSTIRRADTDEMVGDMGVCRWNSEDERDDEKRRKLVEENEKREVGDKDLVWSFGFFLAPSYHGQRLMSPLLHGLFSNLLKPFLRAEKICGAAFASNAGSLRTQEKNGLRRFGSWTREISEARGGGTTEVVVLKWEKGSEEEEAKAV
ncbi:hypothetical protein JCM8097_002614 [Rhodosporidiobolus ruineniae]